MQPVPTPASPERNEPSAAFAPLDSAAPAPRTPEDGTEPAREGGATLSKVDDVAGPESDADPERGATTTDGEPATAPAAEAVAEPDADAKPDADSEPHAGADPEAEPEARADADAKPDADTKPDAEADPEAEPEARADADAKPDADSEPDEDAEADAEARAEGVAEAEHRTLTGQPPTDDDDIDDEDAAGVTARGDAGDLFDTADYLDDEDDPEDETHLDDEDDYDDLPVPTATTQLPLRPGDIATEPITIWTEERAHFYRAQWHAVQAHFVDDPDAAVAQAQALVTDAVHALAETLLARQVGLDPRRHSLAPDTERMRVAMRGYREFLERVLAL